KMLEADRGLDERSGALALRLVQQHPGRDPDVERLDPPLQRDRDARVAAGAHTRADARPLRAEHEDGAAAQLELPGRRRAARPGRVAPEVGALAAAQHV